MPTVISSKPGAVRLVNDAAVQARIPPLVALKGSDKLQFNSERAIITSIGIQEQTNHQFMQTLGSDIYVYVFGDKIGQMTIGGMAFAAPCGGGGGVTFANNLFSNPLGTLSQGGEHGVAKIRSWYNNRKLSSRVRPVNIVIGNSPQTISGFVTGWSANVADVPSSLVQWNITLALIPERVNTGGGGGGGGNLNVGVTSSTTVTNNVARSQATANAAASTDSGNLASSSVSVVREAAAQQASSDVSVFRRAAGLAPFNELGQ